MLTLSCNETLNRFKIVELSGQEQISLSLCTQIFCGWWHSGKVPVDPSHQRLYLRSPIQTAIPVDAIKLWIQHSSGSTLRFRLKPVTKPTRKKEGKHPKTSLSWQAIIYSGGGSKKTQTDWETHTRTCGPHWNTPRNTHTYTRAHVFPAAEPPTLHHLRLAGWSNMVETLSVVCLL